MAPNSNFKNRADEAFVESFTPEFIAQQERLLKQIEARRIKSGRVTRNKIIDTHSLAIRHAVYC